MTMLSKEELRAAAHRKVDEADEAMLRSILEVTPENEGSVRLSDTELQRLRQSMQQRIDGEQGFTLNEIVADYKARRTNGGI